MEDEGNVPFKLSIREPCGAIVSSPATLIPRLHAIIFIQDVICIRLLIFLMSTGGRLYDTPPLGNIDSTPPG